MKNNSKSDKRKGSKSFYAALGISAVMVGTACWFAYDQGSKIADDYRTGISNTPLITAAVDRKVTDLPKKVTSVYVAKSHITTTFTTAAPVIADEPPIEVNADVYTEETAVIDEAVETAAKLENITMPLSDISNVLSPFSGSELVKNETTGSWQTHNGTDIAAEVGADVFAVYDGEIVNVSNDALWGVTVVLDHKNGYITKYCGLGSDLAVCQGDKVSGGDVLGVVGNTADIESAVQPHLHIELTHNGKYIDPIAEFTR